MGRGRPGTGVEPLKTCIRVKFTWGGRRCVETLNLKPTAQNIRAVERQMATIKREIETGAFDYAEHFPTSLDAPADSKSFRRYSELYLANAQVAHSTLVTYQSIVRHWVKALGLRQVATIKRSEIGALVADITRELGGGTVNSYVSVLRGIFDIAMGDGLIESNPVDRVKAARNQPRPADPLTITEMRKVMDHMHAQLPLAAAAFYDFAFMTGLRPSEQIALRWSRIDWERKTATIDTAHVRRLDKVTKTGKVRDVDLTDAALATLRLMKPLTWRPGEDTHVFVNPRTGLPWRDNEEQRVMYFLPTLSALGMKARDAYQTRHSYATALLMDGTNIGYIASQLGHSSVAMTLKVYAKWIVDGDKGRQAARVNRLFVQQLSTTKPKHLKVLGSSSE